jgi:hypothetical protein
MAEQQKNPNQGTQGMGGQQGGKQHQGVQQGTQHSDREKTTGGGEHPQGGPQRDRSGQGQGGNRDRDQNR